MKPFLTIVAAAIVSGLLNGCGTTPYDLVMTDQKHAQDTQACQAAGIKPDTNQFAKCMQEHELARMDFKPTSSVSPR